MPTATNRGDTPDKSEMRACPFCGGNLLKTGTVRCTDEVFWGYVECECGTVRRIDSGTEADAIAAWNTRASSRPAMVERVARAIAASFEKGSPDIAADLRMDWQTWEPEARAAIAALQAVPAASEVDRLPENYELSHGPLNGDMSDCAWQVHSVNGGYNDREWTLVATGETPSEAIRAALNASGEE